MGIYTWENSASPLTSDYTSFVLAGWPGLAADEWFLFSTWVVVQTTDGAVGFVEAPVQIGSANLVPLFNPVTGEVVCTGMKGARLIAVATVFKLPESAYGSRPPILPTPGMILPTSR